MKLANCPTFSGLFFLLTVSLLLGGCGLQTELPPVTTEPDSSNEKAVQISRVRYTDEGVQITCQINNVLVSPNISLLLFIEFEGTRIETIPLQNTRSHEFNTFTPDRNGNVLCVVVYAESEFASDSLMLDYHSP